MGRGGRNAPHDEPERRCVATGESGGTAGLIRFVAAPDGTVTPDLAEKLPGRGVWVTADAEAVAKAVKKNLFARGLKLQAKAPEGLVNLLAQGLARRTVEALAIARKAGLVVSGFDQARARLKAGPVGALIEASDGSPGQRAKLRPMAGDAPIVAVLTAEELGLAFGREFVIHAVLDAGGATDRFVREARRLAGFRAAELSAAVEAGGAAPA
jgi:predicted RNA-binding protein YlxR (DUF448 family)/ribosomal protein L30E